MQNKVPDKIDFIITWVDGNDPVWLAEKAKYQKSSQNADSRNRRYRDWDTLQYLFRGIEKFAPWVNNVYFVTAGHLPKWLNVNHPKLQIVNHKDFIPAKYLPTFSSRPIELNFHRIPNLSECFVYFNDDMFLTAPTKETDFFKNDLPCDTAVLNALCFGASSEVLYTAAAFDMALINKNFSKKETIKNNFWKWFTFKYGVDWLRTVLLLPWKDFTGLMSYHLPYSCLKSTYEEVWEKEAACLTQSCMHKFREITDVNQWVISYWQIAKGMFSPRSPRIGRQFQLSDDPQNNANILYAIKSQKYKMICMNDGVDNDDTDELKDSVKKAFETILPEKSSYEAG